MPRDSVELSDWPICVRAPWGYLVCFLPVNPDARTCGVGGRIIRQRPGVLFAWRAVTPEGAFFNTDDLDEAMRWVAEHATGIVQAETCAA